MVVLQPAPGKAPSDASHEAYLAIERFLKASQKPVLIEPGDDPLPVIPDSFALTLRGAIVTIECWSDTRNLVRRVRSIKRERRGLLELEVERFGGRTGILTLADLDRPANRDTERRGSRFKYRERFRQSLHRQFPDWTIAELSTEPDLQRSLSPSFPRALLRKGRTALAAIGASKDALAIDGLLSFGLIWLDHLRRSHPRLSIGGLVLFVPLGHENTTCHRVRYLNPEKARFSVYVHSPEGFEEPVDPRDYTNFETRLDPCCRPLAEAGPLLVQWVQRVAAIEDVERRDRPDGSVSLAVHGLEFARAAGEALLFGIDRKHAAGSAAHVAEIEQIARGLARMRHAEAADRRNPLFARHPESWLEAQVRANIETIDATLRPAPIYGQVPEFAGGERGVLDLLAIDHSGRLAVIEIKADEDIHLPLQALDYWMRVKWHLDRGDFAGRGYFPGIEIRPEPPRLILVAPALDWHPSNETVLRSLSPELDVECLGVGIQWRRDLRVMFRSVCVNRS